MEAHSDGGQADDWCDRAGGWGSGETEAGDPLC